MHKHLTIPRQPEKMRIITAFLKGGMREGGSMKKAAALIAAMLVLTSVLMAGGSGESASGELSFGTGGDQGTYYGFGSVLAQRISSETDTKITAVVSNGSQDNIEMMDMGYYQLGFVQSDVMSYAYEGTNLFEGNAITDFSTIGALYMEQVQIVTLNPSIKTSRARQYQSDHQDQAYTTTPSMFSVHMASRKRTSHRHTRASETASMRFRMARSMRHSS